MQTVNKITPAPGQKWTDKISHAAQLGGIETAVLDNGAGRGTRVAWINTGTGLRYRVVIDRAMDIMDAFFNQHGLAWLSHSGITAPQPFSDKGSDWLRTFGGGLLTTCGLSHMGGPETDEFGSRGQHGLISNTPCEIESILQPDPFSGRMEMSITGRMRETRLFAPGLELRRTISGTLGQPVIRIRDEVTNLGNRPAPHMLLYHFNFGWPLIDEGTDLILNGPYHHLDEARDSILFNGKNNFRKCPAPLEAHRGTQEAVGVFDVPANAQGYCICGAHNASLGIAVSLKYKKEQLPWLSNWQHWGPGEYVTGIEPGTNPPIGQAAARKQNQLVMLAAGETREYDLELEILADAQSIHDRLLHT